MDFGSTFTKAALVDVGTGDLLRELQSRIGRLRDRVTASVTGRPRNVERFQGAVESGVRFFASPTCLHRPEVYGGIAETEAAALLQAFFRARR